MPKNRIFGCGDWDHTSECPACLGPALTSVTAKGAQLGSFSGERSLHPEALWSRKLLGLEAADKNVY